MEWLEHLDRSLLLQINGHHSPTGDFVFYWASSRAVSIPFYILFIVATFRQFNMSFLKLAVAVGLLILFSDQLSVFIKDHVMRYRPCYNKDLAGMIRAIDGCGGMYGFVSSHAANCMALSVFLIGIARNRSRAGTVILVAWTLLVSYSRIYLGRHYPADVAAGWLLGFGLAVLILYFYRKFPGARIRKA
jgi:undecaprenyl-diphosphatase